MTARLTPSERTVLVLRANGRTRLSIAREQGISQHTVRNHEHGALLKLGVESLPDGVWAALIAGVISREEVLTPAWPVLAAALRSERAA
jgi:NarL family two-component system response regulator LiaR